MEQNNPINQLLVASLACCWLAGGPIPAANTDPGLHLCDFVEFSFCEFLNHRIVSIRHDHHVTQTTPSPPVPPQCLSHFWFWLLLWLHLPHRPDLNLEANLSNRTWPPLQADIGKHHSSCYLQIRWPEKDLNVSSRGGAIFKDLIWAALLLYCMVP